MCKQHEIALLAISLLDFLAFFMLAGCEHRLAPDNNGYGSNGEIYVMEANGSNQINLTNNPTFELQPTWSPNGTEIAFTSATDGDFRQIYVMNADGSNRRRLTRNLMHDSSPAWSPNGAQIAFVGFGERFSPIYVIDSNGSNQRRLTQNSYYGTYNPSWSPDGEKILFALARFEL
jgi:TolB protein